MGRNGRCNEADGTARILEVSYSQAADGSEGVYTRRTFALVVCCKRESWFKRLLPDTEDLTVAVLNVVVDRQSLGTSQTL